MEFRKVLEARCSVRQFRPDPVEPQDLRELVRMAALAPSPNNSQPWRFIAITDRALLGQMAKVVTEKLAQLAPPSLTGHRQEAWARVEWSSTFFAAAPAVIAVELGAYRAVLDDVLEGTPWSHDAINELRMRPDIQCLGAAVEHLLLAAADMGYGGCWLSGPLVAREELEHVLGVSAPWRLAALVALGRPTAPPRSSRERKPLDEILEIRS